MGIVYTIIRGIPQKLHLDSFEEYLGKNKMDEPLYKEISLKECFEIEAKNNEIHNRRAADSNEEAQIKHLRAGRLWKGLFTDAQRAVLSQLAFTGDKFTHVKILEENSILKDGVRILSIPKSQTNRTF